ncbi:hypothetical protein [Xenorhabdus szentirmaii]|uniref:Uncharacterized protein n=1 Tax=Xenorhabdus szentirmaii DSM 16338 TaxID=1427518 RepID=W1J6T6_9GAMM|nr:hypothetical protein [Xenorhabdus szentirmaii]PHM30401.1 hypothetical protein Xsze_04241 [Xenorhabdus szentirmaii DSM 16338]CDL85200.1 exported hypothetical protein [Xenorhabdus szentirmaii DSM 16338]
MNFIKKIIIIFPLILSMTLITQSHANDCLINSKGKIKDVKVLEDGRHFSVSFGNMENVEMWRNLDDYEGLYALRLLSFGFRENLMLKVESCHNNQIIAFRLYSKKFN